MKRLIILGSTGSIGVQALEVAERNGYRVTALAAGKKYPASRKTGEEI